MGIHTAREEKRKAAIPCVLIIGASPQANNLLGTRDFPKIHLLSFLQNKHDISSYWFLRWSVQQCFSLFYSALKADWYIQKDWNYRILIIIQIIQICFKLFKFCSYWCIPADFLEEGHFLYMAFFFTDSGGHAKCTGIDVNHLESLIYSHTMP